MPMAQRDKTGLLDLSQELLLLVLKFITPDEVIIQWGPSTDYSGTSEAMSLCGTHQPKAKEVLVPRRYRAPAFKISYASKNVQDIAAFSHTCKRMDEVVRLSISTHLRVCHPYDRDHTRTCACSEALMRDLSRQPNWIQNTIRCIRISMTKSAPSLLDLLFSRRIWESLPRLDRVWVESSQGRPNIIYVTQSQAKEIRNLIHKNATTYPFQSDGILLAIDSLSYDAKHARIRQQEMQKEITRRQLTFYMSDCVLVLYPGVGIRADFELPSDRERIVSVETVSLKFCFAVDARDGHV